MAATTVSKDSATSPLEHTFKFSPTPDRAFNTLTESKHAAHWEKWGFSKATLQLKAFAFDNVFKRGMADDFLHSLFRSPDFLASFQLGDGRGGLQGYPHQLATKSIKYSTLTTQSVSLDLFDPATTNPDVVATMSNDDEDEASGNLQVRKMMDVYLSDGVTVSDQFRSIFMLGDESEHYDTFDAQAKREFLYHLMWRVVSGGALNQFEDNAAVYKDFVRDLYKDLVTVGRNATNEVEVTSHVFQIFEVNHGEIPLFPKECGNDVDPDKSNFNFFYVVVNPTRRECVVWYHSFWSPF